MVLISSTTNHWPQNHIDDQKDSPMASSTARVMDKSIHEQQQQHHQQELRCPRCDSSNTKFCYYNNYSLSQPRHFCKACKRYWTRGGTLRNVPVGGGCRKNKRVKKPPSSSPNSIPNPNPASSSSLPHEIDLSSNSSAHMSSLFYGLPNNPSDHMNVPFTGFNPVHRADRNTDTGFDLQPQLNMNSNNTLGLGFSSGVLSSGVSDHNGFSNSLISSYSLFGNPTSTTSTSTIASLLASKFINGDNLKDTRGPRNHFQTSFDQDLHVMENQDQVGKALKHLVKVEGEDSLEWNNSNINVLSNGQNQADDHQIGLSDPNSLYWNATTMGTNWHDPSINLGSSVTSLI